MFDRLHETQQSDLNGGSLERLLDSKKPTLIRKGRSKRGVIISFEEFSSLQADADETRRLRQSLERAIEEGKLIPAETVHREAKARLKRAMAKNRRTNRA